MCQPHVLNNHVIHFIISSTRPVDNFKQCAIKLFNTLVQLSHNSYHSNHVVMYDVNVLVIPKSNTFDVVN